MTTTFGADVSKHQPGLEVADIPGDFLIARATFGDLFIDQEYARFRQEAEDEHKLFAAYVFVLAGDDERIKRQAALAAKAVDEKTPIILDLEPTEGSKPTLQMAFKLRQALSFQKRRVSMLYLPEWYHSQIGSPSLQGWPLFASRYPDGFRKGAYDDIYTRVGANDGRGWNRYGGQPPLLWQYTSSAVLRGYTANTVDMDAFRGTRTELANTGLFRDFKPAPVQPKPVGSKVVAAIKELEQATPAAANKPKVDEALRILKSI